MSAAWSPAVAPGACCLCGAAFAVGALIRQDRPMDGRRFYWRALDCCGKA